MTARLVLEPVNQSFVLLYLLIQAYIISHLLGFD